MARAGAQHELAPRWLRAPGEFETRTLTLALALALALALTLTPTRTPTRTPTLTLTLTQATLMRNLREPNFNTFLAGLGVCAMVLQQLLT